MDPVNGGLEEISDGRLPWRLNDFVVVKELHSSSSGAVLHVRRKSDGCEYALKRRTSGELGVSLDALYEYKLLRDNAHRHIVSTLGWFGERSARTKYIVLEWANGGDLHSMIERGKCSVEFSARVVASVSSALEHLHSNRVVHRDVKALNILLFREGEDVIAKLADLGVSRPMSNHTIALRTFFGTPLYASPELCEGASYGPATDIWSLGIVLYELLTSKVPFNGAGPAVVARQICTKPTPSLPSSIPRELADLTYSMLSKDPRRRPTAAEVQKSLKRFLGGHESSVLDKEYLVEDGEEYFVEDGKKYFAGEDKKYFAGEDKKYFAGEDKKYRVAEVEKEKRNEPHTPKKSPKRRHHREKSPIHYPASPEWPVDASDMADSHGVVRVNRHRRGRQRHHRKKRVEEEVEEEEEEEKKDEKRGSIRSPSPLREPRDKPPKKQEVMKVVRVGKKKLSKKHRRMSSDSLEDTATEEEEEEEDIKVLEKEMKKLERQAKQLEKRDRELKKAKSLEQALEERARALRKQQEKLDQEEEILRQREEQRRRQEREFRIHRQKLEQQRQEREQQRLVQEQKRLRQEEQRRKEERYRQALEEEEKSFRGGGRLFEKEKEDDIFSGGGRHPEKEEEGGIFSGGGRHPEKEEEGGLFSGGGRHPEKEKEGGIFSGDGRPRKIEEEEKKKIFSGGDSAPKMKEEIESHGAVAIQDDLFQKAAPKILEKPPRPAARVSKSPPRGLLVEDSSRQLLEVALRRAEQKLARAREHVVLQVRGGGLSLETLDWGGSGYGEGIDRALETYREVEQEVEGIRNRLGTTPKSLLRDILTTARPQSATPQTRPTPTKPTSYRPRQWLAHFGN